MLVTENLKNVEEKIAQACLRSGRLKMRLLSLL